MSAERLAQIAVSVLFLALLRTVGEYFRLRALHGPEAGLAEFSPYVGGLGVGVIGTWAAVLLYFAKRFRAVVVATLATIAALLLYKVFIICG